MTKHNPFAQHTLSTSEISRLARRYWLPVLIVFVAGTISMWAALPIFFTELYSTQVRLLVKIGRENAETPRTVQNGQVFSQGVRIADINSEVEVLSSRALVEKVVDQIGVEAFRSTLAEPTSLWGYPKYYAKRTAREAKRLYKEFLILASIKKRLTEREEAIVAVSDGVQVEPVRDSDVFRLQVSTPAPDLSVRVARALLNEYFLMRSKARGNPAGTEFFSGRVEETKRRLKELEDERVRIRNERGVDSPEEQRTQYLRLLNDMKSSLTTNSVELARLQQETQAISTRAQGMPSVVDREKVEGTNPGIQPVQERLTELKVERAKLSTRYLADSEMVQKIQTEIADLERVLEREPATIVSSKTAESNPTRRNFEAVVDQQNAQIVGLQTRSLELARQIPPMEQRIRSVSEAIDELEDVDREVKRVEEEYLTYAKRLEEARMSEALDAQRVANVVAVEEPETPIEPSYPNKLFLIEIAMAASLVLGLAFAAVLETTEDRILNERSLAELGNLVCIGTIRLPRNAA